MTGVRGIEDGVLSVVAHNQSNQLIPSLAVSLDAYIILVARARCVLRENYKYYILLLKQANYQRKFPTF